MATYFLEANPATACNFPTLKFTAPDLTSAQNFAQSVSSLLKQSITLVDLAGNAASPDTGPARTAYTAAAVSTVNVITGTGLSC